MSVFWGDQVFIPSAETGRAALHHVEILCKLGDMLNEEEWKERRMEKYGLIAVGASDEAVQVEKVNYSTAKHILRDLGNIKYIGVSLGSFSVSSRLLMLLLNTFKPELQTKKVGYFDFLLLGSTISRTCQIPDNSPNLPNELHG